MAGTLIARLAKGFAPVIREYVGREVEKLRSELAPRLKAVEDRPTPEHVGSWTAGTTYGPMKMVQHGGSCWCALRETTAKPGESDAWRLVAKAGRDAR